MMAHNAAYDVADRSDRSRLPAFGLGGIVLALGLIAAAALPASAQNAAGRSASDAFLQQQRAIEEQIRGELDKELPADQRVNFDYGGWYSFFLMLYDDGVNSSRTFRQHDIRAWSSATIDQGAHEIYVRGKLQYQDFNTGDSFDGDDDDWVGPNLDRGYYQFDLRRAMKAYQKQNLDWNFNIKVGRDLVEMGTGYAFSLPVDHVRTTVELGDFEVMGLAATSIRSTDNIDRTRPDNGRTKRNFWGTEIKYKGIQKHEPFVYALWNEDLQSEHPVDPFRNYHYDSYYLGTGSTGELASNLRYSGELVFEGGKSFTDTWFPERKTIDAWGLDFLLDYTPQWALRPRFIGEYMFASGDADRTGSPTNVRGGNRSGRDTSFVGFGYRDVGLSLAPRLSNIHIWRAGASIMPFENSDLLRNLELGTDWFLYSKHHANGAISDFTADERSGYVGWEMDYYANWRITADLSATARLGTFFPGDAFSDQTTRTFFMVGMTYSF